MSATGAAEVVLFDLDGVLADSRRAITSCMNAALVATGHPPRPEAELARFIGPSLSEGFAELMGADPDDAAVAACVHTYRDRYAEVFVQETTTYPGVPDAVAAIGEHHRLGVATSKPGAFAEPLLDALGLRGYFEVVAAPGLSVHVESKTVTVGAALDALGGATRGAMVGDRGVDMVAARAHGLRGVGALWGFGTEAELREAGADVVVREAAELPGVLAA